MIISSSTSQHPIIAKVDPYVRPKQAPVVHQFGVLTVGGVNGMRKLYEDTRYLLIFLSDNASLMFKDKKDCIYQMLEFIGESVGRIAGVVLRQPNEIEQNLNAVRSKFGSQFADIIERSTPSILVIEVDYDKFDPEKDRWAIIKLSDLFDASGRPDANLSENFTRDFIEALKAKESVFDFLYNATIDRNRSAFLESIQLRPGIFGFNVDLKKWLKLSLPRI